MLTYDGFKAKYTVEIKSIEDVLWFSKESIGKVLYSENKGNPNAIGTINEMESIIRTILDSDEILYEPTESGVVKMWVSESGFYTIFLQFRKNDAARKFQRWVTRELLPSYRKGELSKAPTLNKNDISLLALRASLDQLIEQENQIQELHQTQQDAGKRISIIEENQAITMAQLEDSYLLKDDAPAFTARAFLIIFCDIRKPTQDQCKQLGGVCAKLQQKSGKKNPYPSVIDGRYAVNQWPRDILFASAKELNLPIYHQS